MNHSEQLQSTSEVGTYATKIKTEVTANTDDMRVEVGAHKTVLLGEAVQALLGSTAEVGWESQSARHFVDGTFGRGGHTRELLAHLGAGDRLTGIDCDPQAVAAAQALANQDDRFRIVHSNYANLDDIAQQAAWPLASLDGLLVDLGVSSPQLDQAERGFSFMRTGPLDMRMDNSQGLSAADWLNTASVAEISQVLKDYGEERMAQRIAKTIVAQRAARPLVSTADLLGMIQLAGVHAQGGKHPATRSFQAVRMHINQELTSLQQFLNASLKWLKTGGALVVISFHSLEDRLVKGFMRQHSRYEYDRSQPFAAEPKLALAGVARVLPSEEEIARNPRSRSAVMRYGYRTEHGLHGSGL